MTIREYQELMKLLSDATSKANYLPKLFPARPPSGPEVDLQIAQKKAFRDLDASWDKFKQRAKELNAWNDEAKQNPLI